MATTITCDRCGKRIPTEAMNNRVQLVKWHADATRDEGGPKKALTQTFDLCDFCESAVIGAVCASALAGETK